MITPVSLKRNSSRGGQDWYQFEKRKKKVKVNQLLPPLDKIKNPSSYLLYKRIEDNWVKNINFLNLSDSNLKSILMLTYMDLRYLKVLNLNQNCLTTLRGLQKCNLQKLEILYLSTFHFIHDTTISSKVRAFIYVNYQTFNNKIADLQTCKLWWMCPDLMKIIQLGNPIVKQKWQFHRGMI